MHNLNLCKELSDLENKYLGPQQQTSSEPGTSEGLRNRSNSNSETNFKKLQGFKAYARPGGMLKLNRSNSNSVNARSALNSSLVNKGGKTASFLRRNYEQFKNKSAYSDQKT